MNIDITVVTQKYIDELFAQQDFTQGKIQGAKELHARIAEHIRESNKSGGDKKTQTSESSEKLPGTGETPS